MDLTTKRTVIRLRIDKAREDLVTAQELLKLSRWRAAVNRAYYTIFHITSAALLWLDVERKKHAAIEASFNQVFIKPGLLEVEYGRIYKDARKWREEQDYKDIATPLDEAKVAQIVGDAERFVARLEQYLREVGAIEE